MTTTADNAPLLETNGPVAPFQESLGFAEGFADRRVHVYANARFLVSGTNRFVPFQGVPVMVYRPRGLVGDAEVNPISCGSKARASSATGEERA